MKSRFRLFSTLHSLSFTLFVTLLTSCNNSSNGLKEKATRNEEGKILATKYCSSCHNFTDPSYLDKLSWTKSVLPGMAVKLGIEVFGGTDYVNEPGNHSAIAFDDWIKIVQYYEKNAPDSLKANKPPSKILNNWSVFTLKKNTFKIQPFAKTMLVETDTQTNKIYTSDGNTNILYCWNSKLQLIDTTLLYSPAVSANFYNGKNGNREAIINTLGTMNASDISRGNLLHLTLTKKIQVQPDTLAQNLPRPVQSIPADFNNDGLTDWLICGFGHTKGALSWFEQTNEGKFKKNIIAGVPGALQAEVRDFNNDGWADIMALFGHDDESVRLFLNDKHGSFTASKVLQFLPVAGSSSFQLTDFNKDGLLDILYTCGDNADYSPVLKPYHGVYIYLNQGNFNFKQSWFYPVNGCTKAMAADFDKDGDLDFASIAFFADFKNNPAEKFLYFEQVSPLQFVVHSPPITKHGRWICMDVSDYDKDGDDDIVLGNFAMGFLNTKDYKPEWDLYTPFIVLENTTVHSAKH